MGKGKRKRDLFVPHGVGVKKQQDIVIKTSEVHSVQLKVHARQVSFELKLNATKILLTLLLTITQGW